MCHSVVFFLIFLNFKNVVHVSSHHCDTWQYLVAYIQFSSNFSLILFYLVPIFINFVQISSNFAPFQIDQI